MTVHRALALVGVGMGIAAAVASCGGSTASAGAPTTGVGTPPAACLSVASDDHGSVAAFFASTVGAIRRLPIAAANENLAAHGDGEQATVCYIDGAIPKGPPPAI